jgi:hypothetical protein
MAAAAAADPDANPIVVGDLGGGRLRDLSASADLGGKPERRKERRLHPTQMCVGYLQVREKEKQLGGMKHGRLDDYLRAHPVPAVNGIDDRLYIVDHHHLCMAAHKLGVARVYVEVVEDWSHLSVHDFWAAMHEREYVWLHDEHGRELPLQELPERLPSCVHGCKDDPYRSIAGFVRMAGGFAKDSKPFAEFKWANFYREHLPLPHLLSASRADDDSELPESVLQSAVLLAKSPLARGLPGFAGGFA